ncbi:unnamed protein product [Spirodela intermedia]|uniref:F-box domain-containing protein n=1 Tax=Spirodela intermedia TaxID=51605 RepID=A0A7I8LFW4_SPIIN|nr:unnamed protein product [Spirodela intermedia]
MVGPEGCVLSQLHSFFNHDSGSFQKHWYLLAHMILVKSSIILSKNVTSQSTKDDNISGSNDTLFPGLPDDLASDCLAWTCRSDYPSLACVSKKLHSLIKSGYLYKLRRRLGMIEHWVYLACSLMPWEAFDPARDRWMRLPRMPCDECFSYADKESLAVGTQLLVFGRELTGFAIWMYNLVNRGWSRCPLLNLPRCLFGSGSCGEIAIVAGGSDKNGNVLKCAELYNSELGTWVTLPDMNLPRKLCSGFFMDGKFYVIGGMPSHTDSLTCGEEFDLETRTWRRIKNMYPGGNRATQSPPLVAVVNNQLYAADQSTNEVKKYDKANNTWHVVKPLPVRADSYNGWGLAFKACGDRLLVIGGHRGPQGEVIVLHSWSPEAAAGRGSAAADWSVLSVRERAGTFVYNCAVMGC